MSELNAGAPAPDFDLLGAAGKARRLSDLKGKPAVVYFYPKDDTEGCTREALDFTAAKAEFDRLGVPVIGVSADDAASHDKFCRKHDLTIGLVPDPERKVIGKYGMWVEKSMYGRTFMGVERSTFLVGADGKIARVWRKVRVPGHVEAVLEAAREAAAAKGRPSKAT
jgi:peroxiredoxin Q/BCP